MKLIGPPYPVVHCVYSLGIGGQEMVILSLVTRMDRSRFLPRVLCLSESGDLAPRFEAVGVPVDVLSPAVGGSSLAALGALRRYFQQHQPAILHTHNPAPHQYGALARIASGVPVLVHTKHGRNPHLSARGRLFERLAGRLTDMVVPVSQDAADVALNIDRVRRERIRLIRNGIDASKAIISDDRVGWRAVHVARLNAVKDQVTLLRAARLVRDREPRFTLDLVGDGEMRAELEILVDQLDLRSAVRFHGFTNDVWSHLATADLFVLSSLSEGIAITLLEAMAAALPTVATDVGGNREVVIPGETGLLVPAANPEAMAAAMYRMLADPDEAARFGRAGRERVLREFSLDGTVREYEGLYLELLQQKPATASSARALLARTMGTPHT